MGTARPSWWPKWPPAEIIIIITIILSLLSLSNRNTITVFLSFQIAAISPADINYEESFSTLRYGDFLFFLYFPLFSQMWWFPFFCCSNFLVFFLFMLEHMVAFGWRWICVIAFKYKIKVNTIRTKLIQTGCTWWLKTLNSGPRKANQDESHCERGPHWKADQASSAIWRWSHLLWKGSQWINGDNDKGKDNDKDNYNYIDNGND